MVNEDEQEEVKGPEADIPNPSYQEYLLAHGYGPEEGEGRLINEDRGPVISFVYSTDGRLIEIRRPPDEASS